MAGDLALTSVEEKSAFLKKSLPIGGRTSPLGDVQDWNHDGFVDWKDLTVPSEKIYQLRDTDGDGTADKITVFADGFNSEVTGVAAGVLYYDGWVYATIAPDLWRFKDTNDDGVADVREIVVHGFGLHIGYGGHDMHGLMVGTDGRIYWSIGDKAANVTSREGRHFFYPNEGSVLRIEADGSNFEVYAHGVRNVQEPAFNDFGDLIGVDNDADFDGERERFVYLAEGSDNGWRHNYQYMGPTCPWMMEGLWKPQFAGQPAYFVPPIINYSDGPAGFKRDPGTALGDDLRGIFLLNEFPSGKMRGFQIEPDGASYKMVNPGIYNEGIMGVGMSWNSDGSLMMTDWIAGWVVKGTGAIWKVDVPADRRTASRAETQRLLSGDFSKLSATDLEPLLAHADQRVRLAAQFELVRRQERSLLLRVAQKSDTPLLGRLHAIWGYGQLLRQKSGDLDAAVALLRDADAEVRTQTARIIGDAKNSRKVAASLIPLLADASPRVRLQAAIALGKLHEPAAVDALFAMAEQDIEVPVLRHAVVSGLTGCATAERLAQTRTSPSLAIRLASVIALRRQASPLIAAFLDDAEERVASEAAHGIHDDFSIPAALPQLAAHLGTKPHPDVFVKRSINANYRLGTPETGGRLLNFALDASNDRAMREEALTCLRLWPAPSTIDRVDGHARLFQTAPIDQVLTPRLDELLGLSDPALKAIGIEIMNAHKLKASPAQIASIVRDAQAPEALRAQAFRLLASNDGSSPVFADAQNAALSPESPATLHIAALELLRPRDPDRFLTEAQTTLRSRSVPEQQHALAQLAQAASPAADAMLQNFADQLVAGTCPPPLQLDVIDALRARSGANDAFATALKTYEETSAAKIHAELAEGGNPESGHTLIQTNLAASCSSCHTITGKSGSTVGPYLGTVGARLDAAYLVESLVLPSAKVATGYGVVSVTLKDGTDITGTLAAESVDDITLRLFDGNRRTVLKTEIAQQTAPISVMPPMLGVLQPREIRDVVAYLSTLKGRKHANANQSGEESP
jgi:putative membrane-bound dehydrogenase-like protein